RRPHSFSFPLPLPVAPTPPPPPRHSGQRERTRHFCKDWLCPVPYPLAYYGRKDRERLLDQPERCAFRSDGESLLRPSRPPHGRTPRRRHHARWCRPRRVPNCSSLGRRTTHLLPP